MKKVLLIASLFWMVSSVSAVTYCASAPWGYGNSATGGGNATPTLVKSESEFKNALKSSNKVIIITQNITISDQISTDKGNLTIMALPGKRLISNSQTKDQSGILYLKGSNIILRNITFEGPGAYDCDGKDLLTLDGAKNVWVDHCDFQDGMDGNFDIKGLSDNISVTWCRFRYLKTPKAGGSGGADDHRFSNLVGSSSSDKPSDGTYNITYGYCWWDEGCKQRRTRCRNCELHFLNCYWNSSVADYYVGPENAKCYFEGCTFAGKANSPSKIWSDSYGGDDERCTFVNCSGNLPDNTSPGVAAPTYSYDALTPATAKNYVTNSSCGTGATLTVSSSAEVSSSCDGDDPQPPTHDTIPVSGDCCVNLGLGEAPTAANSGIPADFALLNVTAYMSKSSWDQGYLNLGGNADYVTFDFSAYETKIDTVTFDVTIPNWEATKNTIAYHWNDNPNTTYPIASAATETVQLVAPENAISFTIQRSAGTSTRIAQVCFVLSDTEPMDIGHAQIPTLNCRKIMHNGHVLIVRDNKVYNLLGIQEE